MDSKLEEAQYSFVKLLVCLQASLELMDDLQGTSLYRNRVKMVLNQTNKTLEKIIDPAMEFINTEEKEETLQSIDRAVHEVIDARLNELFKQGYKPIQ
jgi:hypothetical protein